MSLQHRLLFAIHMDGQEAEAAWRGFSAMKADKRAVSHLYEGHALSLQPHGEATTGIDLHFETCHVAASYHAGAYRVPHYEGRAPRDAITYATNRPRHVHIAPPKNIIREAASAYFHAGCFVYRRHLKAGHEPRITPPIPRYAC